MPEVKHVQDDMERLRDTIDRQDADIAELVLARRAVSLRLQRLKVQAGLPSVDLSREKRVRMHYGAWLGEKGRGVGDAILNLCRNEGA